MGEPAMIVETARQRLEPLGGWHLGAYVGRIVDLHAISRDWAALHCVPR